MLDYEIIRKKRDGHALTEGELTRFFTRYQAGKIPDYQMSALLMAIYFSGLDSHECAILTRLMIESGKALPKPSSSKAVWIDKHSTGGVGDKTSLILVPLVTAVCRRLFGKGSIAIPMISGRALGHTGGTLDKMSSVPGFSFNLSIERGMELLKQNGFFMMGQTDSFVPLDRRLYALRDVTGTVESIPLIVSSILSKKLSENLDALVLDVKVGEGAFMKDIAQARNLASSLFETSKARGVDTVALITSMTEPLGKAIGNRLEVEECERFLMGVERDRGLYEVTLELAAQMVSLGGRRKLSRAEAKEACEEELDHKEAFQLFRTMFESQGGDWNAWRKSCEEKPGVEVVPVTAPTSGFIQRLSAYGLGRLGHLMGAGRENAEDTIHTGVGILLKKKVGDRVSKGEVIAELFHSGQKPIHELQAEFGRAMEIGEKPSAPQPWVIEVLE